MNCSGRGILVDGECECFDGWTSYGDMRAQAGLECDISTIFVRVVYALPLVLFPFAAFHSARELWRLSEIKGSWRSLCRFSNKVFVIHAGTVISSIVLSMAYIGKIIDPSRAIGIDPAVSWLFFTGMTFFFIVVAASFELFVRISIKQEKFGGSKSLIRLMTFARYLIPFLIVSMCTAFFLVLAAVYVRQTSVQDADNLIIAYWVILGVTALLLLISTPITLHSATRDLDAMVRRHESDGKAHDIAKLSAKLHQIRRQSTVRGIVNTTVFFTMAFYSEARYWGPYVMGLQAMLFSLIVVALATLTNTKSNGSSSTRASKVLGRFGSKERMLVSKESKESKDDDSKNTTKEDIVAVDSSDFDYFKNKQARVAVSGSAYMF